MSLLRLLCLAIAACSCGCMSGHHYVSAPDADVYAQAIRASDAAAPAEGQVNVVLLGVRAHERTVAFDLLLQGEAESVRSAQQILAWHYAECLSLACDDESIELARWSPPPIICGFPFRTVHQAGPAGTDVSETAVIQSAYRVSRRSLPTGTYVAAVDGDQLPTGEMLPFAWNVTSTPGAFYLVVE